MRCGTGGMSCAVLQPGGEEEVRVVGYRISRPRSLLTNLVTFLLAGLPRLLARHRPAWWVALTCCREELSKADRLLATHTSRYCVPRLHPVSHLHIQLC